MYAIVETGGKQYRVEPGAIIQVEKVASEVGQTIEWDTVRLVHGESGVLIGKPLLDGARVTGEVIRQGRTRSITIFKKKRRKNYRRTKGHRQYFSQVRITGITTP